MKSREPSASNRLWAPALSLIQIFRSASDAQWRTRVKPAIDRETAGRARDAPSAKLSRFCRPK